MRFVIRTLIVLLAVCSGVALVKAIDRDSPTANEGAVAAHDDSLNEDRTDVPWQAPRTEDPDNLRSF